eukprot:symbB.v1.2.026816.t1/scaffold2712.1/size72561/5
MLTGSGHCPKLSDFSDANMPLQKPTVLLTMRCFQEEEIWTSDLVSHVLTAINSVQRTRVLAQTEAGTDSEKVCFNCEDDGIYKVPKDQQEKLLNAYRVAQCLFSHLQGGFWPPLGHDVVACSAVISTLARGLQWQRSLQMLKYMEEVRMAADLIVISAAVLGLERLGRWQAALQVLQHCRGTRLQPDVVDPQRFRQPQIRRPRPESK